MSETVWLYWENMSWAKRRSPYLDLCLDTIRNQSDALRIQIVDRESALELLPDLDRSIWNALPSVVFRADYLRTRLVHEYGGIWIDIDCVVMNPLTRLLDLLEDHEFVGWGDEGAKFTNNLFAARPGARFVAEWIANQDKAIAGLDDLSQLPYHALGRLATEPVAAHIPYHRLARTTVAPISWFEWRRFLSRVDSPARVVALDPLTVMLWNGRMNQYLWKLDAEEILRRDMLLSRLLRIALGYSSLRDELDLWTRMHFLSDLRFSPMMRVAEGAIRNTFNLAPY
jgi:hypothetical protein